jgi:hypothetical protein
LESNQHAKRAVVIYHLLGQRQTGGGEYVVMVPILYKRRDLLFDQFGRKLDADQRAG